LQWALAGEERESGGANNFGVASLRAPTCKSEGEGEWEDAVMEDTSARLLLLKAVDNSIREFEALLSSWLYEMRDMAVLLTN